MDKEVYFAGKGCTCAAHSTHECCCGADWTVLEVYALRKENEKLRGQLYALEEIVTGLTNREE